MWKEFPPESLYMLYMPPALGGGREKRAKKGQPASILKHEEDFKGDIAQFLSKRTLTGLW